MAAEAFPPVTTARVSADEQFGVDLNFRLHNYLHPEQSFNSTSFFPHSEAHGDNLGQTHSSLKYVRALSSCGTTC